jgi:hypothetical protein
LDLSLKAILGLDGSGFELGIKRAQSAAEKFTNKVQKSVGSTLRNHLVGLLGIHAIKEAIRGTIQYGSEISDTSDRLDVSAEAMQKWSYALKQNGADAGAAVSFFEKLGEAREKALGGDSDSLAAFQKLGVSAGDLRTKRIEDIGLQIGNAVKAGDAQKLIGALRDIGGKGAGALVTAFKAGLSSTFADAQRLGLIISDEDIKQLDRAGDAIERIALQLKVGLAPAIVGIASELPNLARAIRLAFKPWEAGKVFSEMEDEVIGDLLGKVKDKILGGGKKTGGGAEPTQKQRAYIKGTHEDFFSKFDQKQPDELNINSLQQMGALVRTTSVQSDIKTIAQEARRIGYTTRELLNEAKRPKAPPPGWGAGDRTLY